MQVRCQLFSRNLFCSLLCFGLLSFSSVANAQVYKSYDADGNVVFSDKPKQGSQEVEVTKPNLSDSFEIPPSSQTDSPPETPPEAEPEPVTETQPVSEKGPADTNNDGRISRREKEEYRKLQRNKKREMEKAAAGDEEN